MYRRYVADHRDSILRIGEEYCSNKRFTKGAFESVRFLFTRDDVGVTGIVDSCFTGACKDSACNNCVRHLLWVYAVSGSGPAGAVEARLCAYDITTPHEAKGAVAEAEAAGLGGAEYVVLDHPLDLKSVAIVLQLYGSKTEPGEYENFFDLPEDYQNWLCKSIRQRWVIGDIMAREVREGKHGSYAKRVSDHLRKTLTGGRQGAVQRK